MITSRNISANKNQRPKSAVVYHLNHHNEHRLQNNQSLNNIRNQIQRTFAHQNKSLKEVRQLTESKLPSKYSKRIDRLCVQYSICPNPKRQKRLSQDVDVQFIAKRYVLARSRQKKKQSQRKELCKSIGVISRRYQPAQPQQFFKFEVEALRKMQHLARKSGNLGRREHPYMSIYEKSQQQALKYLTLHNKLQLEQLKNQPLMGEPDQWQRHTKQVKQIYSGIRSQRTVNMKQRDRRRDGEDFDSFYIT